MPEAAPIAPCLVCERLMVMESDFPPVVYDGGWMEIYLGYGSRFDTGPRGFPPPFHECHGVTAYICDDCFEARRHLMRGVVANPRPRYRVVVEPRPADPYPREGD